MIERKDIEKLATLARITVPEKDMDKLAKDIGTILAYVDQIKEVTAKSAATAAGAGASEPDHSIDPNQNVGVKNVMREDNNPHESGIYTDALLKSAPKSQDGFIEVKKILN